MKLLNVVAYVICAVVFVALLDSIYAVRRDENNARYLCEQAQIGMPFSVFYREAEREKLFSYYAVEDNVHRFMFLSGGFPEPSSCMIRVNEDKVMSTWLLVGDVKVIKKISGE